MSLRWDEKQLLEYEQRQRKISPAPIPSYSPVPVKKKSAGVGKGPNKTEASYGQILRLEFPKCRVVFEGITFHMENGHKYTPDWIVILPDGKTLCVEVKARGKGGYRQPSYQRAKLAFDQCRVEWNTYLYRWAEKYGGGWAVENF